ncbi:MAG: hypothetical protein JXB00_00900 [Bacteroidales bacterium]|nr:hypothetical protein [Bacteroidales bacterium]
MQVSDSMFRVCQNVNVTWPLALFRKDAQGKREVAQSEAKAKVEENKGGSLILQQKKYHKY